MSNTKGNVFRFIIISMDYQVFGVHNDGTQTSLSDQNFTGSIGIAEDGTLWALSLLDPDPDGGGAKLYWSNADGHWNEINTSDPGGVMISGGAGSSCYYISGSDGLRSMDTNGQGKLIDGTHLFYAMDYGGGNIWGVFPDKEGGAPGLHYAAAGDQLQWNKFNLQNEENAPFPISVSSSGNCYGVIDGNPTYFSKNGGQGTAGSGANGIGLEMSFKNWNYLLTTNANTDGNEVMAWVDTKGGVFQNTNTRAYKVLATYTRK